MKDTIPAEFTATEESRGSLSVRASTWCSLHREETRCSCGENSGTQEARPVSTARSSGMNQESCHLTLSERLTPLLISRGLVKGTTLTFGQRLLSRGIPAGASFAPDGSVVDIPNQVCIFWRD